MKGVGQAAEMAQRYFTLFVNRLAYTLQSRKPGENGKHYYYRPKQDRRISPQTIREHLNGQVTIGIYALNPKTQRSKWVAIDADYENALEDLLKLQWELRQDGVEAALEKSRRGAHLWIFADKPLLARHCRIYIYNLALRLKVPVKGGSGLAEGIEVFPRQDELGPDQFGNAIRGPLGIHRATERRYWFYGADYRLEAQLDYLERLRKITETEMGQFIDGLEMPKEFRPNPRVELPPYDPARPQFRILDHVRPTCQRAGNYWARCPSCADHGRDRSGDNLAVSVSDPRKYKCWAGCTKEMIRAALGHPIRVRRWLNMEPQRTMHNRRMETEVLARQGLRLPPITLKCLRTAGIYCQPSISIEHQHLAKKHVLRGVESGGAVAEVGAYASFVDEQGNALPWLQRVDSIGVNGVHAVVVAPVLIRVQMLRIERTYDLLITRHHLAKSGDGQRPHLESSILFYGRRGGLEMELWGKDSAFRNTVCPVFYTRAGERVVLPNDLQDAATRITSAVCCLGCRHCHLLRPRPIVPDRTEHPNALDGTDERSADVDTIAGGAV
jgi:hypothetical protein